MNKQVITKSSYNDGTTLRLNSIFYTIQGEGPYSGRPAIFIRLQGCNLRCYWCDTEYSEGSETATDEILTTVLHMLNGKPDNTVIVVTGGEPMSQNIWPLVKRLRLSATVQIESNGISVPPDWPRGNKPDNVDLIISPKTGKLHPDITNGNIHVTAFKYVLDVDSLCCEEDGLPMSATQTKGNILRLARPCGKLWPSNIYVSPLDNENQKANMKLCADVSMKHGYIVSLQTHKLLEVE